MITFLLGLVLLTDVPQHLQNVSVTVVTDGGSGSGVLKTRKRGEETLTFVWTAHHVVDGLRHTHEIIDPSTGSKRSVIEYNDAKMVKDLIEDGRTVGKTEMFARVVCCSAQQDLALLQVRKKNFVNTSVQFYLDEPIPPVGTKLFHVGSLLGQMGSNSMTTGIISQHGRILEEMVFDQTTVTAFPGCCPRNTCITLVDGTTKFIADLKRGDEVIAYDSRKSMADGTWSDSIQQGNQVLSFQTINGQIDKNVGDNQLRKVVRGKVNKVWETGIKQIYKISTRNKTVRTSGNHPFVRVVSVPAINGKNYQIAQWCRADELKSGDIVAVMKEHTEYKKSEGLNINKTFGQKTNKENILRLCGFYTGDGYSRIRKTEGGEVDLYTFNDYYTKLYSDILINDFNVPFVGSGKTDSGTYIRVSSVDLANQIKDIGLTGYSKTKRVPSWVFQCPCVLQRSYIEGYVDADGYRKVGEYVLEAANKNLICDIYTLAMNLGMGTSNIFNRQKTTNIKGRKIKSNTWCCSLYPDPTKQNAEFSGTTELLPEGLKYERISSIEPDGEEMTYDMEVDKYHNFFANGFLVHNSSGGGVFLEDGRCMGLLVRGAGETFNLIVPVRRMKEWAKTMKVEWAINDNVELPSDEELKKVPLEDSGMKFQYSGKTLNTREKINLPDIIFPQGLDKPLF